jgi:hypothetical protein
MARLKFIYDAGVRSSCFFGQGVSQGVSYSDRPQRLDEEICETLQGIVSLLGSSLKLDWKGLNAV